MSNITPADMAHQLSNKKPIPYETALRLAEIAFHTAFDPATLKDSEPLVRKILHEAGNSKSNIEALVHLGNQFAQFDSDWFSEASDAAVFFGVVFEFFSESTDFQITHMILDSNPESMWDVICACPTDIWIKLLQKPS